MGSRYTTVNISGYNSSPPADDGSSTEANKVKWSTIKTKLPDPLKDAIESVNTKLVNAFDTSVVSKTASSVSVGESDNGKLLLFDASSNAITANLAAAGTLGDGWQCVFILSDATNALTIDPNGSETINGSATMTLDSAYSAVIIRCDGTNFHAIKTVQFGTAATEDTGTSGHKLPFLDGSNTWSVTQAMSISGNAATATSATTATNCSRSVLAGTGLTGGGQLNANRTLSMVTTYGAVGTYVFGEIVSGGITENGTYSGASIQPAGFDAEATLSNDGRFVGVITKGGSGLSGTWRAMGRSQGSSGTSWSRATLFMRVS